MRKKYILQGKYLSLLIWLLLISSSAVWNIYQVNQSHRQVLLLTARSFFNLILTTRQWNSQMGGVYVPVTDTIQPNPYLQVTDRDLHLDSGQTLTKINPAYMTRLIAELAVDKNDVQFHITSLKPIRPANAAIGWEVDALSMMEKEGVVEYTNFTPATFYYMAPLITEQSCLACHEQQGYQLGDIRGGISITMPNPAVQYWPITISHGLIAAAGVLLLLIFHSQLGRAFEQLERQSGIDGLTQLYNRRYFDVHFSREYLRCRRQKTALSILMIDVDCFKIYNDTYGHQAGDVVLKDVANAIKAALKRPGDLLARYGGEEFVVLLPETSTQGALTVAEQVRAAVEHLEIAHQGSKAGPVVTVSIGCWVFSGDEIPMEELLKNADEALYQAKNLGRNRVCLYEDGLHRPKAGPDDWQRTPLDQAV